MAQHIEVRNKKAPKVLQNIGAGIERAVKQGKVSRTSMKWQYMGFSEEGNEVWTTTRAIGFGIVAGDKRGMFEVHIRGREAVHIYLVA